MLMVRSLRGLGAPSRIVRVMAGVDADKWRALRGEVVRSYSAPEAVEPFRQRMGAGLRRWEDAVLERADPNVGSILAVRTGVMLVK